MSSTSVLALTLEDGRKLCYARFGAPTGQPLYFFHGFPGSRLQAAIFEEKATALGVQLIAPDRPGFGQSTPEPHRNLLSWARDVAQLADHLGHERFAIMGVSCGGAYALACAHELPQRVQSVGLMAGMGPMDVAAIRREQMPVLRIMFKLARLNPWLISPMLLLNEVLFKGDEQRAARTVAAMLTQPDSSLLLQQPTLAAAFVRSLAEAYAHGIRGALDEARIIASERAFDLHRIDVPVHVYQGHLDRHVTLAMGRYLARELPRAQLHECPDEGHLSIVWHRFEDCVQALR